LGATLYCLLTGQAPFAETDKGTVLRKVQHGDFPPPRQVKREVPAGLGARCLEGPGPGSGGPDAPPRLPSEEIARWLGDEPVVAYREPFLARTGRWVRKHPARVTGAAALIFTALVALGVGTLLLSSEQARTLQEQKGKLDEQEKRA